MACWLKLEADNDLKVQIMAWRETNSHGELLTAVADVDRQIKVWCRQSMQTNFCSHWFMFLSWDSDAAHFDEQKHGFRPCFYFQVSTAAGLLHAADEERCLVILKSLPAGPRRVADLQTCVREALSVDDGERLIQ